MPQAFCLEKEGSARQNAKTARPDKLQLGAAYLQAGGYSDG